MRRRTRSRGNAYAGKQVERDVGMERRFADRLNVEIAYVAPIDLASHGEAFAFRKCCRRDVDGTEWFWIRQVSRPPDRNDPKCVASQSGPVRN
jgi:hypothetical protein